MACEACTSFKVGDRVCWRRRADWNDVERGTVVEVWVTPGGGIIVFTRSDDDGRRRAHCHPFLRHEGESP